LKSLRSPQHEELLRMLIAAREDAGLNQEDVGDRIHRHQSFVSKYENGESRLEVVEFVEICRAIGVAPERLIKKLHWTEPAAGGAESRTPSTSRAKSRARRSRGARRASRP
jgi:transcriptional regulator with XRE-family HTH domain